MVEGFKKLFKSSLPRIPKRLQTDAGMEFLNKGVQSYLKAHGVEHFVTHSDKKAAVVERFNRTLKTRIWTYFTANQTTKYIERLDAFLASYNESYHRSIGMRPIDVSNSDEDQIWQKLYGENHATQNDKFVDKKVRISKVKGVFDKGYIPNWSEEHFHVKKAINSRKPVYKLTDDLGEEISGQFYKEEIQPIEENRYLIEKVLRKRKSAKGGEELFVKWKGWPEKFNSWISEGNITTLDS